MPKFKVTTTITASCNYTVQVEADNESHAEELAYAQWREQTPEDFQVDSGYFLDNEFDTEQLTIECAECGKEYPHPANPSLRLCHCGQFGHNSSPWSFENPRGARLRPHLIVDGVCTPAPWWHEDPDICAECGANIEAAEKGQSNGA